MWFALQNYEFIVKFLKVKSVKILSGNGFCDIWLLLHSNFYMIIFFSADHFWRTRAFSEFFALPCFLCTAEITVGLFTSLYARSFSLHFQIIFLSVFFENIIEIIKSLIFTIKNLVHKIYCQICNIIANLFIIILQLPFSYVKQQRNGTNNLGLLQMGSTFWLQISCQLQNRSWTLQLQD